MTSRPLLALLLLFTTYLIQLPIGEVVGREMNAYDFHFRSIDGEPMPLSHYRGKVILVVNTASRCGFTSQYRGLVDLWHRFKSENFVVLAVPSNDFGGQEPGTSGEIKEFCEVTFGVDFPITEKAVVSGKQAHPFYRWAKDELGRRAKPRWNFHKYIVGRDGELLDWFGSLTSPNSSRITKAIENALKQ